MSDQAGTTGDGSMDPTMMDVLAGLNLYGLDTGFAANLTNDMNSGAVSQWQLQCFLNNQRDADNDGLQGARISAVFVILITSTIVTFFPVLAVRGTKLKIPTYVYLFARYFGSGVIVATAFIHLLDPAYQEIGPASCVGLMNGWAGYSWPPAISMIAAFVVFIMDFAAERYVEKKYGFHHGQPGQPSVDLGMARYSISGATGGTRQPSHQYLHSGEQDGTLPTANTDVTKGEAEVTSDDKFSLTSEQEEREFQKQISAFLILEFGVLFHSVIIGLTLGSAGAEFATLYVVIVFHQAFEGLGIGARLSAIPFPPRLRWLPWLLCVAYGLTTPIAIAIGLGLRSTYDSSSVTASIVSGILDSISSGILIYTGWVELLARDFLFNPDRTNDDKKLTFMIVCTLLGAGIMALLGKWA